MRNKNHYLQLLDKNPNAGVGVTLAAAAVYAARFGKCEADDHSTNEWKQIARQLQGQYGETLSPDEVRTEMA